MRCDAGDAAWECARGMRFYREHVGIHGRLRRGGGLDRFVFIPHGNISFGKLAQALEYGAKLLEMEANFDQILALVRVLAEKAGHLPAQLG